MEDDKVKMVILLNATISSLEETITNLKVDNKENNATGRYIYVPRLLREQFILRLTEMLEKCKLELKNL